MVLSFYVLMCSVASLLVQTVYYPLHVSYGVISSPEVNASEIIILNKNIHQPLPHKLTFVGDVLMARDVEIYQKKYGLMYPFEGDVFPTDSYVFANFESAVPRIHKPTPYLSTRFSAAESHVNILPSTGITHLSLANNHTLDYGTTGYAHTRHTLQKIGMTVFGHPSSIDATSVTYLPTQDYEVAVIALNSIGAQLDISVLSQVLEVVRTRSDMQIAYIHWGDEYRDVAGSKEAALVDTLISLGIDAIIGHHPHVVQNISMVENVPVIYSLGNFVFDQYFSTQVQEGLLVTLNLSERTFVLTPVTSEWSRTQPRRMKPEAAEKFLDDLAKKSDEDIANAIRAGALPIRLPVASLSEMAII